MQGKLRFPGPEVYQINMDELRATSNNLFKNISDVRIGMIEHRHILESVFAVIEKAPYQICQALSPRLTVTRMRREHLAGWQNATIPQIRQATSMTMEALVNAKAEQKCVRA